MKHADKDKEELIIEAARRGIKTPRDFLLLKNEISEKYGIDSMANYGLSDIYNNLINSGDIVGDKDVERLLKKAKVRTLSGVAVVSVLTKPYPCPGNCLYCPTEPDMPKSYLSNEPAVMRALLADFDPYRQVEIRLGALKRAGHDISKIELIVMGGSFSALPEKYQFWFLQQCYKACNQFGGKFLISNFKPCLPAGRYLNKFKILNPNIKKKLEKEQKKNEKAKSRIVGLTLETRPDMINEKEIIKFREMGCTRVEMGVQSVYDDVLEKNKRGHGVSETIKATKLLKDSGLKVSYHMMPGLYGSDLKKDYRMFKEIFSNSDFQPDMLKIYPCVVTENSELYNLWKKGNYEPYSDDELFDLLVKIKKIIPPYVRISRLVRDIPEESIVAGNKKTNLRQLIDNYSQREGWKCRCIRCREIRDGNQDLRFENQELRLNRINYDASGSEELFLQYIDGDERIYAMLRLRIPSDDVFIEGLAGCAIIREVHTYGEATGVGKEGESSQHRGLGMKLVDMAEKIAKEKGFDKMAVIAGVGAREYYKKLGYNLVGTYMVKSIDRINK